MILPLALIGLISLPVIVAFYMLRLRRRDYPVGSTFLWQQLIRDVEANAPWQRLRFSWLLLVQLLIAAIVVLAAARPFSATTSDLAANVVLIVDTSASMATRTDGEDRMALARERAADVVGRLPEGGRVTVVAAADTANVLVSETDDRDAALEAIDGISATQLPGDLTDAFALASALAARDSDSTIVVVSDASGDELPEVGVGAPVLVELRRRDRCEPVGRRAVRPAPIGRRAAGPLRGGRQPVDRRGDPAARDLRRRRARRRARADDSARPALRGADQHRAAERGDDRGPPRRCRCAGRRTIGRSRSCRPRAALARSWSARATPTSRTRWPSSPASSSTPSARPAMPMRSRRRRTPARRTGSSSSTASCPDEPPPGAALYIDPPSDGDFGTVEGRIDGPLIDRTDPDEPILRFVDLTTVHIGRAREVALAEGMRSVVDTGAGRPLVAVGERDGRQLAAHRLRPRRVRPAAPGRLPAADEQPRRPPPARWRRASCRRRCRSASR